MVRERVPLVTYIAGERTTIGEATIERPSPDPGCEVSVLIELEPDMPLRAQLAQILRRHNV
jgi:hypothetical protein